MWTKGRTRGSSSKLDGTLLGVPISSSLYSGPITLFRLRKPDLSLGTKKVAPETVNGLATVLAFLNLTISHPRKRDMCVKKRIPTILVPTGTCTAPHHSNVRTSTTAAQSTRDKSSSPMIKRYWSRKACTQHKSP